MSASTETTSTTSTSASTSTTDTQSLTDKAKETLNQGISYVQSLTSNTPQDQQQQQQKQPPEDARIDAAPPVHVEEFLRDRYHSKGVAGGKGSDAKTADV